MDAQSAIFLGEVNKWIQRLKEKPKEPANINVCRSGIACIEVANSDQTIWRNMLVGMCDYLLGTDKMGMLRLPTEQREFFEKELGLTKEGL